MAPLDIQMHQSSQISSIAMSKGMVDRLRELREAKMARNAERSKVEAGIRRAAAAGKEVLERSVKEAAARIKNKRKKAKKK